MPVDAWLPAGFALPDGCRTRLPIAEGREWQIYETQGGGRALIVRPDLASRWAADGLVNLADWQTFPFGADSYIAISSSTNGRLEFVARCRSPHSLDEAFTFARALKASRAIDNLSSFVDGIYVERIMRILPTYSTVATLADGFVLGTWLTGGVPISADSFQRLSEFLSWLSRAQLTEVIRQAGLTGPSELGMGAAPSGEFVLAGREQLQQFFRDHVIDIVQYANRYKALGIDFPSAIILYGPPGCGKTFAVERLVEYLGWPCFTVDSSSIGSPYIHETSRKVSEVFDQAIKAAPSVLLIHDKEAFLSERTSGADSGHHRGEEVGEFLRRIPEAVKSRVLIIAMTNHIDMIDAAIQRRGRFDHVVEVGMPSEHEVLALLTHLVRALPKTGDLGLSALSGRLTGRPLSDAAFVVREGARLAAKQGLSALDSACLEKALELAPARGGQSETRRIGFI